MTASTSLTSIKLGATGPKVFPLGLGCMGMSGMYGQADDAESIATIHAAIERGVSLIDTGDFYGTGHNEMLIGRALLGRRERVALSVKFGALRGPDGAWLGFDARPASVKAFAAYSLKRLGVEVIDVYRPSRLDSTVPIEDTIGAIADLVKAGYVRHIGLSEVGVDTIRRAHATHPIVDLQIEYSLASRGPEAKLFPVLDELGISATLYGVFSRGLLTGRRPNGKHDFRSYLPRFNGANAEKNAPLMAELESFAQKRGTTPARLVVAWVRAKRPNDVALLGLKTRLQLDGAFSADAFTGALTAAEVAALEALVPPGAISGTRYGEDQMRHLDSER